MVEFSPQLVDDEQFLRLVRIADAAVLRGDDPETLKTLMALVRARPARAESWYNLGYVQRAQGLYADALASYRQALALGIDRPEEVRLNIAVLLSEFLHDTGAAAIELRASVDLNPNFLPAWLNLAMLEEDKGDRGAAQKAYRKVLETAPHHPRAVARLAIMAKNDPIYADRINQALGQPGLNDLDKAELGLALASIYDALGEYDRAFAAGSMANAEALRATPAALRYDSAKASMLVEGLISQPTTAPFEKDHPSLAFICGMFRSGSTLIEHVIAGHNQVVRGGERDALPRLVAKHLPDFANSTTSRTGLWTVRDEYLKELKAQAGRELIYTDKRPDNLVYCGIASAMFPQAKFILTRRNPLDTIVSTFFLQFGHAVAYAADLDASTHWCILAHRLAGHWSASMPEKTYNMSYDEFVREPEVSTDGLMSFLGLAPETTSHAPARSNDIVQTPSNWAVREPVFSSSSGRWRNYAKHLARQIETLEAAGLPI